VTRELKSFSQRGRIFGLEYGKPAKSNDPQSAFLEGHCTLMMAMDISPSVLCKGRIVNDCLENSFDGKVDRSIVFDGQLDL